MSVYKLCPTIRAKIFHFKQTVRDLNVDKLIEGQKTYECSTRKFKDNLYYHIITGDLSINENENLRKRLQKGPNYTDSKGLNWPKVKECIINRVDAKCQE